MEKPISNLPLSKKDRVVERMLDEKVRALCAQSGPQAVVWLQASDSTSSIFSYLPYKMKKLK